MFSYGSAYVNHSIRQQEEFQVELRMFSVLEMGGAKEDGIF